MGFHSVLKIYKAKELNAFFGKLSPPTNTTTYIVILFSLKICWGEVLKLSQGLFISFFPTNK